MIINKKYLTFFIFAFVLLMLSSQETLKDVPKEYESFLENTLNKENQNQIEPIETTDSLKKIDNYDEEKNIFGLDFFNFESSTNTPVLDIPLQSDYKISFNDELELLLTGNINQVYTLRVDLSGNISIPEIGQTSLLGLTLSEANKKVSTLISNSYISTQSYLSVKKPSAKKVSVIGNVKKPGTYLMNPFISLTEAIKYASGFNPNSSLRSIEVRDIYGNSEFYDLYDFLIFGKRNVDVNLSNGDTIVVNATSNYIQIDGEVHRPMIYEYKGSDSYQDLIDFSLGFTKQANLKNISANVVTNDIVKTKEVVLSQNINLNELLSLFVGSKEQTVRKSIFVTGNGATEGYYNYEKGQKLEKILSNINFSSDIYPFYSVIKQTTKSGLKITYESFSLSDVSTYKDIILLENPEITFFSREDVMNLSNFLIDDENPIDFIEFDKDLINSSQLKIIFIGNESFKLPFVGKIKPELIFDFMDTNSTLIKDEVTVTLDNSSETDSYKNTYDADLVSSISFPEKENNTFKVSITGQVRNPGAYVVNAGTSLDDLYKIAGGLNINSSVSGIYISRESVKAREKRALEDAKNLLKDALISNLSNPLNSEAAGDVDYAGLMALTSGIEVAGRVTGDFLPDSESASQFFLEKGDVIYVPYTLSTVSIAGEVLNPLTTSFKKDASLDSYLKLAGGLSDYADRGSIYIIKANGESVPFSKNIFTSGGVSIEAGDTIVVPRDLGKINTIPLLSAATKIISDIAFAAASINAIQD